MSKSVTIGIPVYTRFEYLPHVLNIVASQDYPNIDLLISDNGMNGNRVPEIVNAHYSRPYRFRQNPKTVDITSHFNQLIQNATGEYFVVLADDDEITPNYISDLVALLERRPEASVAMSIQQTIDESGKLLRSSSDSVPELLSGSEFIKAAWQTQQYGFESFSTFMAKTEKLVACGGFPMFFTGTGDDDALMIKLSLGSSVAFSTSCAYRKRYSEASDGYAVDISDLAKGLRDFLKFLDSDRVLLQYGEAHPAEWKDSKRCLVDMIWKTYYYRWTDLYRKRLTTKEWVMASFNLPFIPAYYRATTRTLYQALLSSLTTKR